MHVLWSFINKRDAVVSAVKAYRNMEAIIENTPDEVREQELSMVSPRASRLSGMPSSPNPKGGEQRIVSLINNIDTSRERYRQALEYMEWFVPAWNTLTDKESTILSEFYMSENLRSGATKRLSELLSYSHSHIERLKNKAITQLAHLLFGL